MKAIVAVKRVVDYNVKVRPKSDGSAVELTNVKNVYKSFLRSPLKRQLD